MSEPASNGSGSNGKPSSAHASKEQSTYLGLRTAIYSAPDLAAATAWYTGVLGFGPYFNEPYYVGFNVGGFELGLIPDSSGKGEGGVTVYWGVDDANAAFADLLSKGATEKESVRNVGGGIWVATVNDPFGNVFGIIENPHFTQ